MSNTPLVLPGQEIASWPYLPSHNTYSLLESVYSSVLGRPQLINKLILVQPPFTVKYYSGQLVLARISKITQRDVRVALGVCEGIIPIESLLRNNRGNSTSHIPSTNVSNAVISSANVLTPFSNSHVSSTSTFNPNDTSHILKKHTLILAQIQKSTGRNVTLTVNGPHYGPLQNGIVLDVPHSYLNHEMNNLNSIGKRLFIHDRSLACAISTNHMVYIHHRWAKYLIRYFRSSFYTKQNIEADEIERIINQP